MWPILSSLVTQVSSIQHSVVLKQSSVYALLLLDTTGSLTLLGMISSRLFSFEVFNNISPDLLHYVSAIMKYIQSWFYTFYSLSLPHPFFLFLSWNTAIHLVSDKEDSLEGIAWIRCPFLQFYTTNYASLLLYNYF